MSLETGYCLGLSDLHHESMHAQARTKRIDQTHLAHSVHGSSNADLRLDRLEVLVEKHAHAGVHGNREPVEQVVVLAEQRVLEVDGGVGDDEEAGQGCNEALGHTAHSQWPQQVCRGHTGLGKDEVVGALGRES